MFLEKKLYLETKFWKTVFIFKNKKKACLIDLIKKFLKINQIKNIFESYFF